MLPSPTQSQVMTALRSFLISILPNGDADFVGSISASVLTVTEVNRGTIKLGDRVLGEGVSPGQTVIAFGTGTGGIGTYTVGTAQVASSRQMYTGVEVIQGQTNRVPQPVTEDFVTMTPFLQRRLATNIHRTSDVLFTASIAGTVMTVSAMTYGTIQVGQTVFASGVNPLTKIIALGTGTGGVGTYTVAPSQTVSSREMASGIIRVMQPTEVTVQLDVHGPHSADNAQVISTLFRDEYGVRVFEASGYDIAPLYVSDPRQLPFLNESQQVENRWVIDAVMQSNAAVDTPMQFADQLDVTTIEVEAEFPA